MKPHLNAVMDWLAGAASDPDTKVYVLLDGARNDLIHPEVLAAENTRGCLYKGEIPPELEAAAPWIVDLGKAGDAFSEWLIGEGWGDSWGIFVISTATLKQLRRHFRKFLLVKREDGQQLYFRFYDPRVARVYLPTCDLEDLDVFFGPVGSYVMEDKDAKVLLRFSRTEEGQLDPEEVRLDAPAPAPAPATEAQA